MAFVLNIFSRRSRGYYGEVGEKFDLPAHASLSRVLQPPQEVRQEQIDAIMQTGLWQAGIRYCFACPAIGEFRVSSFEFRIFA